MDVAFTTPSVPPLPGHTMLELEAGARLADALPGQGLTILGVTKLTSDMEAIHGTVGRAHLAW